MSCSKPKCQRVDQTLKEKLEILNKLRLWHEGCGYVQDI